MDFDQINTIPDLIAHFFDHEEDGESRSFVKFLDDHYGSESEKPTDGHELPFQKHDCTVTCHTVASFLPDITRSNGMASNSAVVFLRSEEHTSELQSRGHLVCRLLLEKKK